MCWDFFQLFFYPHMSQESHMSNIMRAYCSIAQNLELMFVTFLKNVCNKKLARKTLLFNALSIIAPIFLQTHPTLFPRDLIIHCSVLTPPCSVSRCLSRPWRRDPVMASSFLLSWHWTGNQITAFIDNIIHWMECDGFTWFGFSPYL